MSTSSSPQLQSSPQQSASSTSSASLDASDPSHSSAGAAQASLPASASSSLQVGGRGIKRRADGVVYTAENKRIAVHYMFGSSTSRRLLTASTGGLSANAGGSGSSFIRPDGLGPSAEPTHTFGLLGPGSLPPELVEKLRRVEGQADLTHFEQDQVLAMQVDADVGEEAAEFVEATISQAVNLQRDSLQASTNKLWDRPKRNFIMFWKALEKLRASAPTSSPSSTQTLVTGPGATTSPSAFPAPASSSTTTSTAYSPTPARHHVVVTEQKLVTYLNCFVLHRNPRLGMEALWTEIKAVTILWETQQLLGVNPHSNPRKGKLLKSYMKAVKKGRQALALSVREDWWKHSLRDGYDAAEYVKVSRWFLHQAGSTSTSNTSLPTTNSTATTASSLITTSSSGRHTASSFSTARSATALQTSPRRRRSEDSDSDESMTSDVSDESEFEFEFQSSSLPARASTPSSNTPHDTSSALITADPPITARNAAMRARWARISLRSRFEFLMQHALMGRSEDLRNAILAATYTIMLPQSRPQSCPAFVVTLRSGKTNTESRNEWGVAARHRNFEACPVGALALYLFERWHILGLPAPSFSSRKSWYDDKLLVAEDSADISWSDQAYLLRYAFEEVGVSSSKITHAMRSGGARFAHEAGCTEDSLHIHGRWCGDRLIERYLGGVSIQPVRALADFDIKGGDYWLPRTLLDPTIDLQHQIFPFVELGEAQVWQRHKDGGQTDNAALNLPIWQHVPFNTDTFRKYAQSLHSAISSTPAPVDLTINTLVPELGRALGGLQATLSNISAQHATASSLERQGLLTRTAVEEVAEDLKGFVAGLFGAFAARGRAQQALSLSMQHLVAASAEPASPRLDDTQMVAMDEPSSSQTVPPPAVSSSSRHAPLALPRTTTTGTAGITLTSRSSSEVPSSSTSSPPPLSILQLAPHVRTVADLIKEWRDGRDGRPALQARVESGDSTLDKGAESARKQLSRWRIVVGLVEQLAVQGRSKESVVSALDKKMTKDKMGLRALADRRGASRDSWINELGLDLAGTCAPSD
ncbi:hypothetical protein CF326_g6595 [Tilletia indica]|nr:hypothetical protein CF326_g6595 [Tilletia indica]